MALKKKIFLTGSTSFLGSKFIQLYHGDFDIFGIAKHDPAHAVDMLDFPSLERVYLSFLPDVIIHTAAVVDQDAAKVRVPNIQSTHNIISLAQRDHTPVIFMSSESVYGGKEMEGGYVETDLHQPRSAYGETKVESEKIIISSRVPYLILRAHRFVGINSGYHKPKQFPDTLDALKKGQVVHLDKEKLFRPCLINHISQIFVHYLHNDLDKQIIMNVGVDQVTTYYDLIIDVAKALHLKQELVQSDGNEASWPDNSVLSIKKLKDFGYPSLSYDDMVHTIQKEYALPR